MKFCGECGSNLVPGSKFCGNCGISISQKGVPHTEERAVQATVKMPLPEDSLLSEIKTPIKPEYGSRFNPETDCENCGTKLNGNLKCRICGFEYELV